MLSSLPPYPCVQIEVCTLNPVVGCMNINLTMLWIHEPCTGPKLNYIYCLSFKIPASFNMVSLKTYFSATWWKRAGLMDFLLILGKQTILKSQISKADIFSQRWKPILQCSVETRLLLPYVSSRPMVGGCLPGGKEECRRLLLTSLTTVSPAPSHLC